jgi:hypothetical protein
MNPGFGMDAKITVDGTGADVESLWDWLRHEPDLRGRVRAMAAPAPDGTMGAPLEFVVSALATGTMAVLAKSLSVWLTQRHSDVTVEVTGPDGRHTAISAKRVKDPERMLRMVLESPPDPPAGPPTAADPPSVEDA